jgi:hypothetical protein
MGSVSRALTVRTSVAIIIVVFYLVTAATVAALDPGSDTGSAIASGLSWPLAALELAWVYTARFFGPLFD